MPSARNTQVNIEAMRAVLERDRNRILALLAEESNELRAVTEERGETLPAGRDQAELGTLNEEQEELATEAEGLEAERLRVEEALERIKRGTYGLCEDCGKPIPVARLGALPTATRDIGCEQARGRRPA